MVSRPTASPITWHDFNYTPIAVGVVLLYAGGFWILSARKWFTGPRPQGSEAELEAIEAELKAEEHHMEQHHQVMEHHP